LQTAQFWQGINSKSQIHCKQHPFGSERWFALDNTILAAITDSLQMIQFRQWITNSLQMIQFQQRITDSLQTTPFHQWTLICCRQYNFGNECQFAVANKLLVANVNSLQTTQFQQQMLTRCRQQTSATNAYSLQTIQLRQRIPNSL